MINTYKNYIIAILLSALVFMPLFGVNFSEIKTSLSTLATTVSGQGVVVVANPVEALPAINTAPVFCSNIKSTLFNLNQSGDCLSKIALSLHSPSPVYSVIVAPTAKLITTISVIRLWFSTHAVMKGFEAFPVILSILVALILSAIIFFRKDLQSNTLNYPQYSYRNLSLSLLQVYRC